MNNLSTTLPLVRGIPNSGNPTPKPLLLTWTLHSAQQLLKLNTEHLVQSSKQARGHYPLPILWQRKQGYHGSTSVKQLVNHTGWNFLTLLPLILLEQSRTWPEMERP